MKRLLSAATVALALGFAGAAEAAPPPEYRTIHMEIDVAKPAAEAWAKVGKFCDLGTWMKVKCELTSGSGDVGTVRRIADRIDEVLVGKTDLSYGYTQPAVEGKPYNLYHGFLEAKPVSKKTSKLVYTLMYDVATLADAEAKDKDVAGRKTRFEAALKEMKTIAEAK